MEQYAPGTTAYTIPLARRLRGPLDPAALQQALRTVTNRHEALRTRFPATSDGRPVAVVEPAAEPALRVVDAADEQQAHALVEAELAQPVDPSAAPLLRALLIRLAPQEHVLVLAVHHLAADGWSVELLLGELLALAAGEPAKPEPPCATATSRPGSGPAGTLAPTSGTSTTGCPG